VLEIIVKTFGEIPASVDFGIFDSNQQEKISLNIRPGLMQGGWLGSRSISSDVDSIIISASNPIGIQYLIVSSPDISFRVDIDSEIDSEMRVDC